MHVNTIEMIVLAVAVIAFVTIRQLRWSPVDPSRLLRMPAVFALIGVIEIVQVLGKGGGIGPVHLLDVVLVGIELLVGVAAGLGMGRLTEIGTVDGVTRARLRPVGLSLWLGFIGVRIGLGVLGHVLGLGLADQPMTVFFVLAVVKGLQAVLIRERIDAHRAELRRSEYARAGF